MKKLYYLFCLLILSSAFTNAYSQCPPGRYYDKIYSKKTTNNVLFGRNNNYQGFPQDLYMDVYEPQGDNFAQRPLIILAFGGSFTSGVRQSPDLLVLTDEFAKRGYVTATIDYRIGRENGSDTAWFKSVIRGLQDMNAAIRYFYKDAVTANKFRVDTNQIFIGGTSAGAVIGLNVAYYDFFYSSRPIDFDFIQILARMGGIWDGSGNEGYSHNVKGVVSLCGAIMDTFWLQPGKPIVVAVHGTADSTIPFYYDSIRGLTDFKSRFFGDGDINVRCNNIGLTHYLYPFYGADHVPFVLPSTPYLPPSQQYMDTTIWVIRDFLYQNVVCDPTTISGIEEAKYDLPVTVLSDFGEDVVSVISHNDKDLNVELFGVDGRLVEKKYLAAGTTQKITKDDLGAGIYILSFTNVNNPEVLKTQKIVFY